MDTDNTKAIPKYRKLSFRKDVELIESLNDWG